MSNTSPLDRAKDCIESVEMTLVASRYGYIKDGSLYLGLIEDTAEVMAMRGRGAPVVHLPAGTDLTWNGRAFNVPRGGVS